MIEKKIKILFISHTYPPIVGGVESQNFELFTWLSKIAEVKLLANKKRWLIPFFLKYAAIQAFFSAKNYDAIVLGSCILANAGWIARKFSRKPVLAVAHGLDLTWKNGIYQKLWIKKFVPSLDKIICVGNETVEVAKTKGISKDKLVFVPNGIDPNKFLLERANRQDLEKIIGEKLVGKKIILTSGRLARRKGVAWFIRKVMPRLDENIIYVVAGEGPDRQNIENAVKQNNLAKRVKLLGYVADEVRDILFNTCNLFIQPNIKIKGDMEGFGISVIEAASCKIPVVASDLEGLKDAIKDGQNGFLVESGNAEKYTQKITAILADENFSREFGERARQFVIENYSWEKISRAYLEEINKTILNSK